MALLKPNMRRLILFKLGTIAVLVLLAAVYVLLVDEKITPNGSFLNSPDYFEKTKFKLQQNGKYFIYNNFIEARTWKRFGNHSITLATHGTYQDFNKLGDILLKWNGPISITLYASGDDFEDTLVSLYFFKYCLRLNGQFFNLVSIHLVFHESHFPEKFQNMSTKRPEGYNCLYEPPFINENQNLTYWYKNNLTYPINMLRNIARLNAFTYYVLSSDLNLIPPNLIIRDFMFMTKRYAPRKPLKSVYCLPVFPEILGDEIPKTKTELVAQIYPFLRSSESEQKLDLLEYIKLMQEWLYVEDSMEVFNVTTDSVMCPVYVSVNVLEPLFEEHYFETLFDKHSTRLMVLSSLQYDFIILKYGFLIKRHTDSWYNITINQAVDQKERSIAIREIVKLNSLALWHSGGDFVYNV